MFGIFGECSLPLNRNFLNPIYLKLDVFNIFRDEWYNNGSEYISVCGKE